mgnify:CR=1 FL=1
MARDIAQRFNHNFAEVFTLPEAVVEENVAVLQGTDASTEDMSIGGGFS